MFRTEELAWLETDLQQTSHPTVIFTHQRLDNEDSPDGVKNGPAVRNILQQSQVVIAVFKVTTIFRTTALFMVSTTFRSWPWSKALDWRTKPIRHCLFIETGTLF